MILVYFFLHRLENDDQAKEEASSTAKPADNSETESESSQRSQTGKDFEMVDRNEIDES